MNATPKLAPLLVVRGAADALDFYVRALGAVVLARFEHGAERRISHADLQIEGVLFAVTEEARGCNADAPPSLGGSPVVLQLMVEDTDAVLRAMTAAGASVVSPAQELFGERMARVRDPFGHVWLLRQRLRELSGDENQRQRDELVARFAAEGPANAEGKSRLDASATSSQTFDRRAAIHLILGPVGAGKSTYAEGLSRRCAAVRLTLDQWMTTLFTPDRPARGVREWYLERAERCREQIWSIAEATIATGIPVVLEVGLIQRCEREKFYERVAKAGHALSSMSWTPQETFAASGSRDATASVARPSPCSCRRPSSSWPAIFGSPWRPMNVRAASCTSSAPMW